MSVCDDSLAIYVLKRDFDQNAVQETQEEDTANEDDFATLPPISTPRKCSKRKRTTRSSTNNQTSSNNIPPISTPKKTQLATSPTPRTVDSPSRSVAKEISNEPQKIQSDDGQPESNEATTIANQVDLATTSTQVQIEQHSDMSLATQHVTLSHHSATLCVYYCRLNLIHSLTLFSSSSQAAIQAILAKCSSLETGVTQPTHRFVSLHAIEYLHFAS